MIVKRIGPVSLAKIQGIISAFFGVLVGLFFSIVMLLATVFGSAADKSLEPLGGIAIAIGGIFGFPLLYGIIGMVSGLLTAVGYNVVSGWIGGLEIDFEDAPAASATSSEM